MNDILIISHGAFMEKNKCSNKTFNRCFYFRVPKNVEIIFNGIRNKCLLGNKVLDRELLKTFNNEGIDPLIQDNIVLKEGDTCPNMYLEFEIDRKYLWGIWNRHKELTKCRTCVEEPLELRDLVYGKNTATQYFKELVYKSKKRTRILIHCCAIYPSTYTHGWKPIEINKGLVIINKSIKWNKEIQEPLFKKKKNNKFYYEFDNNSKRVFLELLKASKSKLLNRTSTREVLKLNKKISKMAYNSIKRKGKRIKRKPPVMSKNKKKLQEIKNSKQKIIARSVIKTWKSKMKRYL
jgi:hypothetical protein